MGDLIGYDEWLQAQNCLLGAALLDPKLVPRILTELSQEDFSGKGLVIYRAMADLFRNSKSNGDVDAVAVSNYMGGSTESRALVMQFMECSPLFSDVERYITIAKQQSRLYRLRSLGDELATAVTMDDAVCAADKIAEQLVDRPGLRGYDPGELIDTFISRHETEQEHIDWKPRDIGRYIKVKRGKFLVIGAEPSGGKTAFALEQMWSFSAKRRVLFVSLETDEDTLFDRLISNLTGITMDALEDGKLQPHQIAQIEEAREVIAQRSFRILPGAGLSVSGIKAAAISYRAEIVIIDYMQIVNVPDKRLHRFEAVTEISMDLHTLAQTTGLIVIALSQVTNRDPSARNAPLGLHSVRESGQITADADAILMLDKFVEKGLRESGCKANRILRIVKNKNGACCNIPLVFNGKTQNFSKASVPDPNWEKAQAEKGKKAKPKDSYANFEQIPIDDNEVPF